MAHALVTGASRGVGAALIAELGRRGHATTGLSHSGANGTLAVDVTDAAAMTRVAGELETAIDMLVCNAGVLLDRNMKVGDPGLTDEVWSRTLAVNVTGVANTVAAFLPHLKRSSAPRIAVISSQMGSSTWAGGGTTAYRVSKAAAINLALNLVEDLRPDGIAVGVYHPGWVQTDMGGAGADITPEASARGLADRLDRLTMDNSDVFETWDGRTHAL